MEDGGGEVMLIAAEPDFGDAKYDVIPLYNIDTTIVVVAATATITIFVNAADVGVDIWNCLRVLRLGWCDAPELVLDFTCYSC